MLDPLFFPSPYFLQSNYTLIPAQCVVCPTLDGGISQDGTWSLGWLLSPEHDSIMYVW